MQAEYDGNAYQTNPVQSAFTRRREIFVGEGASIPLADVVPSVDVVHPPPYMLMPVRSSNQLLYDGAPHEPLLPSSVAAFSQPTSGCLFAVRTLHQGHLKVQVPIFATHLRKLTNHKQECTPDHLSLSWFAGRTAMTGFFSAVIGELLTGKGVIGQLNLETSLPPYVIKGLIAAIVGFNLVTALLPNATFSEENQQDVRKRPAGETACHTP